MVKKPKKMETTKKAVDAAQKIAQRLDKMAKDASKLAKEGKELGKIEHMLNEVKFFGKASTVLGAVGAVAGIATMFLGTKSAAEQNTELLGAVKNQISQLSRDMERLFEKADKTAYMIAAQARWDEKFDEATDYHRVYDQFNGSTGQDHDLYQKELLELKQKDLMNLADTFGLWMNESRAQQNLLLATYNASFGNEALILAIGTHILKETYFLHHLCLVIAETIRSNEPKRASEVHSDEEVNRRFTDAIGKIVKAIDHYAEICRVNCWTNVEEFLDKQQFPYTQLDHAGYFAASTTAIGESLRSRWPRYDWSVIVYDAVRTFDRHGVASSGIYRKDYIKRKCKDDNAHANIIVAAADTNAHIFDPTNETDISNVWYDLTLNARATMVPKDALTGFHGRNRDGLFFYCLKEGEDGGVRMNYWSKAAQKPDRDTRKAISIKSRTAYQEGRIISSEINLQEIDPRLFHTYKYGAWYALVNLTAS